MNARLRQFVDARSAFNELKEEKGIHAPLLIMK